MNAIDKKISKFLHASLDCLYGRDRELFDYRGKIYERAIVFRLAHYLANMIDDDDAIDDEINVDCEYMNHCDEYKSCYAGCEECNESNNIQCCNRSMINQNTLKPTKTIRPDIIIHKRGSQDQNIMVIEVKTTTHLPEKPNNRDTAKLSYLTCQHSIVKYRYNTGIALALIKSKVRLWAYKNGAMIDKKEDIQYNE